MEQCGIYGIVNVVNGKIYVGQAVDLEQRGRTHFRMLNSARHPNKHLQFSYNKHGAGNFRFVILTFCKPSDLCAKEQKWMDVFPANQKYNNSPAAHAPMLGQPHTEETRARLSKKQRIRFENPQERERLRIANLGKKQSRQTIEKRRIAITGKKRSPESVARIRLINLGRKRSEETRRKIGKAGIGRRHTEEAKNKIGLASALRIRSEETKHKIRVANTGKKHSADSIEKMRRAQAGKVLSAETKRKMSEAHKGHPVSEETKRRISETKKKRNALRKAAQNVVCGSG